MLTLILLSATAANEWTVLPSLPEPVSNNAVTSIVHKDRTLIFSFMGIGERRTFDAITRKALVYDSRRNAWFALPPVPGTAGRIAASAVAVNGQVFVLGGYTVGAQGKEISANEVDTYTPGKDDPAQGYWAKGLPIPIPLDDSVAVVLENRYIVLISGWSQQDNVSDVQIYDTVLDRWRKGRPIPGTPVFGHAGAISGKTIVYCGGAYKNPAWTNANGKPRYLVSNECWKGIVSKQGKNIEWGQLVPPHPGNAQYRMAAATWGKRIVFTGGTDNPYNYDGIGYNGVPSQPSPTTFAWNTGTNSWETLPDNPVPTMDHRGLVPSKDGLVLVGGMEAGQKVTKRVSQFAVPK
ncbi:MAG: kelch motif protein [Candidatus Angelobacter sp.]|nr:kelch motif protein [Candidatus Angelobacter sp.]